MTALYKMSRMGKSTVMESTVVVAGGGGREMENDQGGAWCRFFGFCSLGG